jgi:hypothetical protein
MPGTGYQAGMGIAQDAVRPVQVNELAADEQARIDVYK